MTVREGGSYIVDPKTGARVRLAHGGSISTLSGDKIRGLDEPADLPPPAMPPAAPSADPASDPAGGAPAAKPPAAPARSTRKKGA